MFEVGDKVVYPMHGAGVIEEIVEREHQGRHQRYYKMRLPVGEMTVLIPTDRGPGLRGVISALQVQEVLSVLQEAKSKMSANWNHRYRANMEKIRSGDIMEVAEVVRNLARRNQEKGLSSGERKMLDCARQILISELVLAGNFPMDQANRLVDQALQTDAG